MIRAIVLSGWILRGRGWWPAAAALFYANWLVGSVAAFVLLAKRRPRRAPPSDGAEYFDAVAAELGRGASLRQALAIPAGGRVARVAQSGQPMPAVAAEVGRLVGGDAQLAVAGVQIAAHTGAPATALFAYLADRIRLQRELDGERRALTTQARLSAAVVGLLPVVLATIALLGGHGRALLDSGPTRAVILIGFGMQLTGALVVGLLLRHDR